MNILSLKLKFRKNIQRYSMGNDLVYTFDNKSIYSNSRDDTSCDKNVKRKLCILSVD